MTKNNLEIAEISTRRYIICPNCHKEAGWVDHCYDEKVSYYPIKTAWYCDNCGKQYKVEMVDGQLYTGLTGHYKENCYVILKYHNLYLLVKGLYFDGDFDIGNLEYYYNEHTCPSNYLGNAEVYCPASENNPEDPHGIFEFIKAFKTKEEAKAYLRQIK